MDPKIEEIPKKIQLWCTLSRKHCKSLTLSLSILIWKRARVVCWEKCTWCGLWFVFPPSYLINNKYDNTNILRWFSNICSILIYAFISEGWFIIINKSCRNTLHYITKTYCRVVVWDYISFNLVYIINWQLSAEHYFFYVRTLFFLLLIDKHISSCS